MTRKTSGSRLLALPLEFRMLVYPHVFDGIVLRIRVPPEPILKRRGGLPSNKIDRNAEKSRDALTERKFPRGLGLLLVNRQIHEEVKDVALDTAFGTIFGWSSSKIPFGVSEPLYIHRLLALHHKPFCRGRIKQLAIDTDVLDLFMHPPEKYTSTVCDIPSQITTIIIHTRGEDFFTKYDKDTPALFNGLGMPARPWTMKVGARYSGVLTRSHPCPLAFKKLMIEYCWNGCIHVGIEIQISENKVCLVEINPALEIAVEVVQRKHARVSSQWSLYKRGG